MLLEKTASSSSTVLAQTPIRPLMRCLCCHFNLACASLAPQPPILVTQPSGPCSSSCTGVERGVAQRIYQPPDCSDHISHDKVLHRLAGERIDGETHDVVTTRFVTPTRPRRDYAPVFGQRGVFRAICDDRRLFSYVLCCVDWFYTKIELTALCSPRCWISYSTWFPPRMISAAFKCKCDQIPHGQADLAYDQLDPTSLQRFVSPSNPQCAPSFRSRLLFLYLSSSLLNLPSLFSLYLPNVLAPRLTNAIY